MLTGLSNVSIIIWRLRSWNGFLDNELTSKVWYNVFRVSLKLYSGEFKGLANLPEDKALRDIKLRVRFKDYLKAFLNQCKEEGRVDSSVVRIAIEFCTGIEAIDYLFDEVYKFFVDNSQEEAFIKALEPFILNGLFITIKDVPQQIIDKIVKVYKNKKEFDILEKLLLNLNLSGKELAEPIKVCLECKLYWALIYLKTVSNNERNFVEPLNILQVELLKKSDSSNYTIEKLLDYGKLVEDSRNYVAYTMLYYIDLCFKKKKFPQHVYVKLKSTSQPKWADVIYSIANWLFTSPTEASNEYNIIELIKIDIKSTFAILEQLFSNDDLREILTNFAYLKMKSAGNSISDYKDMLNRLKTALEKIDWKVSINPNEKKYSREFWKFLARIVNYPGIELDQEMNIEVIKSFAECKNELNGMSIDYKEYEEYIMSLLKNFKDISEKLEDLIKALAQKGFTRALIYLREINSEYVECLNLYLKPKDASINSEVFKWLDSIYIKLDETSKDFQALKKEISDCLDRMVTLL
jgi:transposase